MASESSPVSLDINVSGQEGRYIDKLVLLPYQVRKSAAEADSRLHVLMSLASLEYTRHLLIPQRPISIKTHRIAMCVWMCLCVCVFTGAYTSSHTSQSVVRWRVSG